MPDALVALLSRQSGVLTRKQALAAGVSKHAWDWQLSSGRWQKLLPGVVVTHTGRISDEERAWAAFLYGGKDAALAGRAALCRIGTRLPWKGEGPAPLDVALPLSRRLADGTLPDDGAVTIRRLKAPERWTTSWHGMTVVKPQASVLHAASWAASDQQAEYLLTSTMQQRKTAVPLVREALAEMPELTRRALVREVLDDIELGAHATSELRFLRMCRTYGVPLPDELQRRVRSGESTHYLDARYSRQRITVEIDGAHHRDAETWEADALRTLRVTASLPREQVLRITNGMLRNHEAEVAALLLSILVVRVAA